VPGTCAAAAVGKAVVLLRMLFVCGGGVCGVVGGFCDCRIAWCF